VPALEDDRLQPRAREIGGTHQTVVAAADHDRVVALGHANLRPQDLRDARVRYRTRKALTGRVRSAIVKA